MNSKTTLVSLFNKDRETLENKLEGFVLPKDAEKIQQIVCNFLNSMFENDGEYRQQLTQTEDYILQAALGLLNAQHNIAKEVTKQNKDIPVSSTAPKQIMNNPYPYTLAGTAIGGAIGTMFHASSKALHGGLYRGEQLQQTVRSGSGWGRSFRCRHRRKLFLQ